jgi:hypothetical protein
MLKIWQRMKRKQTKYFFKSILFKFMSDLETNELKNFITLRWTFNSSIVLQLFFDYFSMVEFVWAIFVLVIAFIFENVSLL